MSAINSIKSAIDLLAEALQKARDEVRPPEGYWLYHDRKSDWNGRDEEWHNYYIVAIPKCFTRPRRIDHFNWAHLNGALVYNEDTNSWEPAANARPTYEVRCRG